MRFPGSVLAAAIVGCAAFLAAGPSPIGAEPEVVGVEVRAPAGITVGDRFHYVIRLEADEGSELSIGPGSLPLAFEVTNTPEPKTRSMGGGRIEVTFDLEVAAFVPGDVTIPAIPIEYREPDGDTGTVLTPQGLVIVTSVLPQGEQLSLRDLKPQLEIGTASQVGIFLAAIAAVLAALAVVSLLILRSLRHKPVAVAVIDTTGMGPEDRARAILEAAGSVFDSDHDFVTYYGTIAVTMRNYLTERYGFHAFALTTVELSKEMNRRGIDRWQARLVNGLLTQCDTAVYARYMPAFERAGHDLTAAFEIVEMSRPQPEPAPEPQPEAVAAG